MNQDVCEKCLVQAEVQDVGTASGRKYFRCPKCARTWKEKNPAAVLLGSLGGKARAESISPEERSRQAVKAAQTRWETKKYKKARKELGKVNGHHYTEAEWLALLHACDNRCVKCGSRDKLHKDHVVPRYQGGPDTIENLQPLCHRCNASKGPDTTDYRPPNWREKVINPVLR